MGGKVVQLVQGREKALEGGTPGEMLERFRAFPEIQVIDLDAALGTGSNDEIVSDIAARSSARVGGGVRSAKRARALLDAGAHRIIVGTAAFGPAGANHLFLEELNAAVPRERVVIALDSKGGQIVIRGWREAIAFSAGELIASLEPYCGGFLCTYVDKEGMMQGTDLDWFRSLRDATSHEITAAGGITTIEDIRSLNAINVHAALGMAIYTGRLDLKELAELH